MSGDILVCHNLREEDATGIWWAVTKDGSRHPTMHRIVSPQQQELTSLICR